MNGPLAHSASKRLGGQSRPLLGDVTLVAVTSVALPATVQALEESMAQVEFGEILLLSDREPSLNGNSAIRWRKIEGLRSRVDYSRFMLRELADHISTGHALCVQWDGFAINGDAWDPDFLQYDYIGAPWPHFRDGHNVGNGGFSLRSRKLMRACKDLPFDGSAAEDVVIARQCRPQLEQLGLRFAPEAVASKFAFERAKSSGSEFGFHGAFNLVRQLPPAQTLDMFRSLEPGVLAPREHLELVRWALAHRQYRLALTLLSRWLRSRR